MMLIPFVFGVFSACGKKIETAKQTKTGIVKSQLSLFDSLEVQGEAPGVNIALSSLQFEVQNSILLRAQEWQGLSLEPDSLTPTLLLGPRHEVSEGPNAGLCRGRLIDLLEREGATGPWFHISVVDHHWKVRFNDRHFLSLWEGLSPFRQFALECRSSGADGKIYGSVLIFKNLQLERLPPQVTKDLSPEVPLGLSRIQFQILNPRNHRAPWGSALSIGWQVLEHGEIPRPERAQWFVLRRGEGAVSIDVPEGQTLNYWWGSTDRRCSFVVACTPQQWNAELQSYGQGAMP